MKSGPFEFTFDSPLLKEEAGRLASRLAATHEKNEKTLRGRGSVIIDEVGGTPAAIKPYLRGGLWGKINRATYFGSGPSRAQKEHNLLKELARSEVNVPAPLGFIESGSLAKKCWLVMEAIPHEGTLADLDLGEKELAFIFGALKPQIKALIALGVHHVDLHPGNILIAKDLSSAIIDFDKALKKKPNDPALSAAYLERWQRAVKKHRLPLCLTHRFKEILK